MTPSQLSPQQNVSIILPPSLFTRLSDEHDAVGLVFGVYKTATLFPVVGETADGNRSTVKAIGSNIVLANVGAGSDIIDFQNLDDPVTITLRIQTSSEIVSMHVWIQFVLKVMVSKSLVIILLIHSYIQFIAYK